MGRYEDFQAFRATLNDRILKPGENKPEATLVTKRFFNLDSKAYEPGAIDEKHKELLGLSASMVLRCDDCIAYHINRAIECGATDQEIQETFDIALIVGGSIVIPHMRRAFEFLDACRAAHAES